MNVNFPLYARRHKQPCPRICIDDLCRGNRDNTLCGGSYCYECGNVVVGECMTCDDCGAYEQDDYGDSI